MSTGRWVNARLQKAEEVSTSELVPRCSIRRSFKQGRSRPVIRGSQVHTADTTTVPAPDPITSQIVQTIMIIIIVVAGRILVIMMIVKLFIGLIVCKGNNTRNDLFVASRGLGFGAVGTWVFVPSAKDFGLHGLASCKDCRKRGFVPPPPPAA